MTVDTNAPQRPKKPGGVTGKGFQPGQSGCPGGKPKAVKDVIEAARQHTSEAVERLARWMRSDDPRASVAACTALLDRGWGRPTQAVEMSGKDGGPIQTQQVQDAVSKLSHEERLALLAIYRKAGLKLPGEV
jgi:hypothetical protein